MCTCHCGERFERDAVYVGVLSGGFVAEIVFGSWLDCIGCGIFFVKDFFLEFFDDKCECIFFNFSDDFLTFCV